MEYRSAKAKAETQGEETSRKEAKDQSVHPLLMHTSTSLAIFASFKNKFDLGQLSSAADIKKKKAMITNENDDCDVMLIC